MSLILIILIEIFFGSALKDIVPYDALEWILLSVNMIVVGLYLSFKLENKNTFYIIYIAYMIRIILMYVDMNITTLPFSGADTWSFHNTGIEIANGLPEKLLDSPYGVYAQFVGIIYYLMGGPTRMFLQNINIILFIASTISIVEIFKIYKVDNKFLNKVMLLYTWFMPVALFESCILLREMLIVYFITLSICSLLKWMNDYGSIHIVISCIFIFLAAVFHSGVIFAIIPYTFIIGTYNSKHERFIITSQSIMLLAVAAVVVIIGFKAFGGSFTHLQQVDSTESVLDTVNHTEIAEESGSGYLENLKVDSIGSMILYTPIKWIYLLISPMPWKIRGVMDLITFVLDSMVYLILILSYLNMRRKKHQIPNHIYNVSSMLYLTYFMMMIPYSWGTFAAGTAIRHRFKGFTIILIAFSLYKYYENEYEKEKNLVRS